MVDIAASVLAKLKNKAKASNISYQQCLQLFMQEEFLRKLSKSQYTNSFILKGGLFIFVAIPLPGTGVWTGSLIASLLDLRFKYAFPTIVAGNLIASTFDFVIINRHALIHKSLVTCHIFYSKIKLANEI